MAGPSQEPGGEPSWKGSLRSLFALSHAWHQALFRHRSAERGGEAEGLDFDWILVHVGMEPCLETGLSAILDADPEKDLVPGVWLPAALVELLSEGAPPSGAPHSLCHREAGAGS